MTNAKNDAPKDSHDFRGVILWKDTRLGGVEPPHMPPEGIALSTELQTHNSLLFCNHIMAVSL